MKDLIPISSSEFGITLKKVSGWSSEKRQETMDKANELPLNREYVLSLMNDMANRGKVYRIAGLDYTKGAPKGLFPTALADCLLKRIN